MKNLMGLSRRTRAHAAIANAATPEVRALRAAILEQKELRNEIAAAEAEVSRAQVALERAQTLNIEKDALLAAQARLAALRASVLASDAVSASGTALANTANAPKKNKGN